MPRYALRGLLAVAVAVPLVSTGAAPATAQITGRQSFHGFLLVDGTSGRRDVVASPVVARGILDGVGRIVEVASRPGDPDNVVRDDFVFRIGRLHTVTRNLAVRFAVDSKTCRIRAHLDQRGRVTGGTGAFRDAFGTYSSTVDVTGRLARKADGTCNDRAVPLHERDVVAATGHLTY